MTWLILQGDAGRIPLKDESVHMVCTSPPYWGLRNYGLKPMVWGGREDCEHEWTRHIKPAANGLVNNAMQGETLSENSATRTPKESAFCSRCNAWNGVLGLEPMLELYVQHLVEVFREVRRVLRSDGCCFVNLGDSYAGSGKGNTKHGNISGYKQSTNAGSLTGMPHLNLDLGSLKPKDLCGIPWRVALALQADGWWLRRDIIWSKAMSFHDCGNSPETRISTDLFGEEIEEIIKPEEDNYSGSAMPESVNSWRWERHRVKGSAQTCTIQNATDCPGCLKCEKNDGLVLRKGAWRPITSHEYMFLLTKSADYFCDAEAAREGVSGTAHKRQAKDGSPPSIAFKMQDPGSGNRNNPSFQSYMRDLPHGASRNLRSVWQITIQPLSCSLCSVCSRYWDKGGPAKHCGEQVVGHFAAFPEELVEKCIKAGTSEKGVCPKCQAPWVRIVERSKGIDPSTGQNSRMYQDRDPNHPSERKQRFLGGGLSGWQSGPGAHDKIPKGRYSGKWADQDSQSASHRILARVKAARDNGGDHDNPFPASPTIGWRPSCKCIQKAHPGKALLGTDWLELVEKTAEEFKPKPAVILDPFSGAGTTVLVADKLGRIGVGIDAKWEYCQMARERIVADAPLLTPAAR